MGTNYFWHHDICTCCKRFERLHVCKSLVTFRGHFGDEWDEVEMVLVYPPLIVSWKDWTEKLLSGGEVWNEYGDHIDTHEFINQVESTDVEARRRNYDWHVAHQHDYTASPLAVVPDGSWLDDMGFSFYGREFS